MRPKPTPTSLPISPPISPPTSPPASPPASPSATASWTSPTSAISPVRAAFAALAPADQRLLDAVLFDGQSCTDLARSLGIPAADVRRRLGAAMRSLHAVPPGEPGGAATAAMLALHALDALDADEAALVDAMLAHQPALQRAHAGYRDLVAELCLITPPLAPSPRVASRLLGALGDDTTAN
ncbi:MAG TPA: hypothetical protein VGD37_43550 [Kofleriaceae bacterium]